MRSVRHFCIALLLLACAALPSRAAEEDPALAAGIAAYQKQDYPQALALLQPLAERGVPRAQAHLGLLYDNGAGVAQSYDQALGWYRKAAAQGDGFALFLLGVATQLGHGMPVDLAGAAGWYEKAVAAGETAAMINLGYFYEAGMGVAKDPAHAASLYRRAAEAGNGVAQANLAFLYLNGNGVAKDYAQAALWNQRAAAQGNVRGLSRLGLQTMAGLGVQQDFVQARVLLLRAAERRDTDAFYLLGVLDENGQGAPKNLPDAYVWYGLAAKAQHPQAAARRDALAAQLSPTERAAAEARIAGWQPGQQASAGPRRASSGSGMLVDRAGSVLTSRHVVEGCAELRIAGASVTAVASDAKLDLALLRTQGLTLPAVAAFRTGADIRAGESVVAAGYPYGGQLGPDLQITTGTVTTLAGPGGDRSLLQFSAPIQPGNSGGPLLDLSGHVVGVATSKLNALRIAQITGDLPQNVNFALSLATARGFLEAQGVHPATAASDKPLSAADVGDMAKQFTLQVECWK